MLQQLLRWLKKEPSPHLPTQHLLQDLRVGDIIQFADTYFPELDESRFQVIDILTYKFLHYWHLYFKLKSEKNHLYFITLEPSSDALKINISRRLSSELQHVLFKSDDIISVVEEAYFTLKIKERVPDFIRPWIAESYYKTIDCRKGIILPYDYRNPNAFPQQLHPIGMDFYELRNLEDTHSLKFEVFVHGKTEIHAAICIPITKIKRVTSKR